MHYLRGILGGIAGSVIGVTIYWWLLRHAILAPILVPGLVGLGCGLGSMRRSRAMGAISAGMALGVTILADAWLRPFAADHSVFYFIMHLHRLDPIYLAGVRIPMLLVHAIGIALAFWFGLGRDYLTWLPPPPAGSIADDGAAKADKDKG